MKQKIKKYKRFIKYVLISVFTAIINIIIYLASVNILSLNEIASNIIAWIVSVLITFFLNRQLVFNVDQSNIKDIFQELFKFYLLRISSLIIDTAVLYACLKYLMLGNILSKAIANLGTTFNNYFISKYFIFNKKRTNNRKE